MELFYYLLKVSACLVLFFACYLLVLRKLTFFKINRFYLLGTLVLSFTIPALQITIEREVDQLAITDSPIVMHDVALDDTAFQGTIQLPAPQGDVAYQPFDWYTLLPYGYAAVVALLLGMGVWRLGLLLKHTKHNTKAINGLKIVVKTNGFTNCSFFNYVFVDHEKLTAAELSVLLRHEAVHVKQLHSIDKMIMIVAKAVLWFNPIIYLYDKALEEAHEYEADQITSVDFGADGYANLLLRLAVEKSQTALVHNFVKSPIKARIKMLFNDKSKNMKKLMYLLTIPIVATLTWCFTINVVYAFPQQIEQGVKQDSSNQAKNKAGKLKAEAYRKSPAYLAKLNEAKKIDNQVIKGKIGAIYDNPKAMFSRGRLFIAGDKTYVLQAGYGIKDLKVVKEADEVEVKVANTLISPNTPYLVIDAGTIKKNGTIVYVKPPVKKEPFLYEANRARYTWSKIYSIAKTPTGVINKIVLNDKTYTINLNIAAQQFINPSVKTGDEVLVKFYGEKLTGKNTYTTDKMIVLYHQAKNYELKNKLLYNRFYNEDGTQIVPEYKTFNTIHPEGTKLSFSAQLKPKLLSSANVTINAKNNIIYLTKAKMEIGALTLTASDIVWNKNAETLYAEKGTLANKDGQIVTGKSLLYDLKSKTYKVENSTENNKITKSSIYDIASALPYNAEDSIRVSKLANTVTLYGRAKINIDNNILSANKIEIDKNSNVITAYGATLTSPTVKTLTAGVIKFDVSTKEIKTADNKK